MKLPLRSFGSPAIIPRLQQPAIACRTYATHHSTNHNQGSNSAASKRKAVTPFNDTGFVPWNELSIGEKASRATQQTFNFGLVVVGLVLTGGIGYFLYTDVFSPESRTAYFNRAVDRIKKDPECVRLLGDGKKIIAHGEETSNKWRRARPIAFTQKTDPRGNEHLIIHFHVEGPLNDGVAYLHLTKGANHPDFEYKYFWVDIKGHPRIYLENADTKPASEGTKNFKMFGVNWR
ncbi:mitochondrial import inner membrane translocase subunit TIM21 [Daldinia caldariorum]|uniref:mitochondrial import inner membrane translocase subunit TIM21 n=1 Tax=Daldinia caldariorum TaxID=326644 RepID=UPI0020084ED2|nr:mitochondrial import inner membrane translocase subunit TIM21 [Daldinia caldariorum]KAI1468692.1 mitochondrial import inner membrane translocase subunit TIM21 [Daldinia caldariorum]